ncbi:cupin domain-containing protein [Devosia sediminis]|uniref:Cupin domain-containing protein n=1 Tax=Devosia sediminis TaxID=2798801 RepID=A0A934MLC5_9HYPH|nr:cupin domain-containing protein [Devosia sediminis]MBJ3784486.1 cupin domain-containing protein [Devosia sediminis]
MSTSVTPVVRLSDALLESSERGTMFGSADAHRLGTAAGLKAIGFTYTVVEPGRSGAPFHNHHVEDEMFVVMEGEGTYRFGPERYAFKAGDVLVAPAGGQETAHQIINTGSVPLKMVAISNQSPIEVCEYPDSGKFLVSSKAGGNGAKLRHISRHPDRHIEDYWEGEPGA